jgi:hypothetical protein
LVGAGGLVFVGLGLEVGLCVGLGVLVGGTGVSVGASGVGVIVGGSGDGVDVAVCTRGVLVGVTGVGVLVGAAVSVGTGVWVGVGVSVNVGLGVLVGVGEGPSRRDTRSLPEQASIPMNMAITATRITIRFFDLFIVPPNLFVRQADIVVR